MTAPRNRYIWQSGCRFETWLCHLLAVRPKESSSSLWGGCREGMSGSGAQRMGKRLPWWAGPHPGVSVDAKVHTLAIEAAAGAAGRVGLELRETSERTCAGGHSLRTVGVKPVGGWLAKVGAWTQTRQEDARLGVQNFGGLELTSTTGLGAKVGGGEHPSSLDQKTGQGRHDWVTYTQVWDLGRSYLLLVPRALI